MSWLRLACRAVLLAYPRSFREGAGADIEDDVVDRTADRHRAAGRPAAVAFAGRELAILVAGAWRARASRAYRVTGRGRERGAVTESALTDVGHAWRGIRRSPGAALVVVVTLGLGIGGNTAIFSVVDGVLLQPLPYPEPHELAYVTGERPWLGETGALLADVQFARLREETTSFEEVAALRLVSGRILGGERPVHTDVGRVSASFFDMLGVRPQLGRTFVAGEDVPGTPWVAVLSHGFWMRAFGGDPDVVGRGAVVGWPEMEIVGVLPPDFHFRIPDALGPYGQPDLWIPTRHEFAADGRGRGGLETVLVRLAEGVSMEEARAELTALGGVEDAEHYGGRGFTFGLQPLHDEVTEEVRPALLVLLAAVGLVLLIATANIATLVLARTHARLGELAVRRSLGASGMRLARQLLTENLALAAAGGLLALAVAGAGTRGLLALAPVELPRIDEIGLDGRVLLFTAAATVAVGLLAGLGPALRARAVPPLEGLPGGGPGGPEGRTARSLPGLLVVGQVALSLVLLTGAGLLARTFVEITKDDPGFQPEGALTFSVYLMEEYEEFDAQLAFYDRLRARLAALPGVTSVSGTSALPLSGGAPQVPASLFEREGDVAPGAFFLVDGVTLGADALEGEGGKDWSIVDLNTGHAGWFETAGTPLLAGRDFREEDHYRNPLVVVVDEQLAARFWGTGDPIGERLWIVGAWREVVGVARHTRLWSHRGQGRPQVYVPYGQVRSGRVSMVVRPAGEPLDLLPAVRAAIAEEDPLVPIGDIRTLEDIVRDAGAPARFAMTIMGAFAASAVLLAALGLYGVLSFSVGRRRREIALRLAIGSTARAVEAMVVREGLRLAATGIALGLGGALLFGHAAGRLLPDVDPADSATYVAASGAAALVALLASWVPARHAVRVGPATALREE